MLRMPATVTSVQTRNCIINNMARAREEEITIAVRSPLRWIARGKPTWNFLLGNFNQRLSNLKLKFQKSILTYFGK